MVWDKYLCTQSAKALEKKLESLNSIDKDQRRMYKVHEQLRDVNEKAYKPVLLAIGPYNDQDKVGQGFMQEHKLRYLQQMRDRTGGSVETYIRELKGLEEEARKCYVECISQTPDEFVEMMLLDGCFIIELFRYHKIYQMKTEHCQDDPIFQMSWVRPRIARDLLLFENQLPFSILAKLFEMSESNRSGNSGEHSIDMKDETRGESSTSTPQSILTRPLLDLALGFFRDMLPFRLNYETSSYNSEKTIKDLVCKGYEALTPSLPSMVHERLEFGFRFKNGKFEHLLDLIHAIISISILDSEINGQAGVGNKCKMCCQIFKHLLGPFHKAIMSYASKYQDPVVKVDWKSIEHPHGVEFQNAEVALNMAKGFMDKLDDNKKWETIYLGFELREAGIKFEQAEKFKPQHDHDEPGPEMNGAELKASHKFFKRLRCLNKYDCWKSIPYSKELRKAGIKLKKAKKFKHIHDLNNTEAWNIHCATELQEAGIKLKKAEKSWDGNFSIKFNNGLLEISPLSIEDQTETYLRNLIAYEQYCDEEKAFNFITNYVCFMDGLIDSPKDVELLRRRGIIRNYLGDDEVASKMVNNLGHNLNISTRTSIYARTSRKLNKHCRRRGNVWMAKLRRDYFNSPWAWMSFLAALLLLALTITQTVFSIIH